MGLCYNPVEMTSRHTGWFLERKNEMKKYIALLLTFVMLFALCACGAAPAASAEETVKEPTDEEYAAWAE